MLCSKVPKELPACAGLRAQHAGATHVGAYTSTGSVTQACLQRGFRCRDPLPSALVLPSQCMPSLHQAPSICALGCLGCHLYQLLHSLLVSRLQPPVPTAAPRGLSARGCSATALLAAQRAHCGAEGASSALGQASCHLRLQPAPACNASRYELPLPSSALTDPCCSNTRSCIHTSMSVILRYHMCKRLHTAMPCSLTIRGPGLVYLLSALLQHLLSHISSSGRHTTV